MSCLARLINEESKHTITPTRSVYVLKLCENKVEKGSLLCSKCSSCEDIPKQTSSEFNLNTDDGCLIYRKIGGKEFEAKYNKQRGTLTLTTNQPVPWPQSLLRVFTSPTKFAKETYRAAQGLDTDPKVNGWVVCYTKDEKGKPKKLQEIRSNCSFPKESKEVLHGLLTEVYPSFSSVYGSPTFYKYIEKGGEELPMEWLEAADEVEQEAKERCKRMGLVYYEPPRVFNSTHPPGGFPVEQEPAQSFDNPFQEMPPKKQIPKVKPEDLPAKAKVTSMFRPITKYYNETADEPMKLVTDTQKIWKEDLDGETVWRCETGFVFKDLEGKPGRPIGKYIDDDLKQF